MAVSGPSAPARPLWEVAVALPLGLGLLVTIPVSFGAVAAAYDDLFRLQSDYSQEVPKPKTP